MFEKEGRLSRRKFLKRVILIPSALGGLASVTACSGENRPATPAIRPRQAPTYEGTLPQLAQTSCVNLTLKKDRRPFKLDPSDIAVGVTYVDNENDPGASGLRIIGVEPRGLLTRRPLVERIRITNGFEMATSLLLEPDNRTLSVLGQARNQLEGNSEWRFQEIVIANDCNRVAAFWVNGRIVDAQLNDQTPASLRIVT
jgi:hypothetical protein